MPDEKPAGSQDVRVASVVFAVSAALFSAAAAPAPPAAAAQPPMGQFDGAFYTCDQSQAFQVSYDSKTPKAVTLTTSNNNRQYHLKRVAGAGGAQFSDGAVNVSVSGDGANVQGTEIKLTDCKLKNTT